MPIEIALAQTASDVVILAFDGRILEIFDTFWEGRTQRFHVAMLDEISLVPNKKGGRTSTLRTKPASQENSLSRTARCRPRRSWWPRCSQRWPRSVKANFEAQAQWYHYLLEVT